MSLRLQRIVGRVDDDCGGLAVRLSISGCGAAMWLGATSVHSRDFGATAKAALTSLLSMYAPLHVVVNHFDPGGRPAAWSAHAHDRLTFTWVPDMKGLFW